MADLIKCSSCGTELPPGAPGGHCPKCLLGFAEPPDKADALPVSAIRAAAPGKSSRSEEPGDSIGHYKLLEKIGEGGCGVVYMAEQLEPFRRRVALKVIKPGMDSKEVLARFDAERQVLAMMDHPNIAKVFDAGTTDSGRPFFVMELVRGVKITEYCDQNNLSTKDRLGIFIQICRAVHHAHQKGIIHRDIKPSNILVTLHDGVAVPKVIDFGIAKATTGQVLTDKTFFTAFEQFIGTPAYMSPEQAEMSGLGIDPRSDIYSLGVLLYELLTDRLPFDSQELIQAGLDGMRRMIREKDPMRPSTRLSALKAEEQTTVARRRQTELAKLVNLLRGDLDWIVMKCLEKDRNRRYDTPNSLALDIQRYLDQQPVIARPPGNLYRLQKLVRRKKAALAAAAAMAATLVAAVAISTQIHKNQLSPSLSAEDRRKLDGLMLIVQDAAKAPTPADRAKALREYLAKSADFALAHPAQTNLWVTRAAVAVELGNSVAGSEAGRKLRELGLENSDDAKIRKILADLNRNGWIGPESPKRDGGNLFTNSVEAAAKDTANLSLAADDAGAAATFHDGLAPYGKWMDLNGQSYWQPNAVTLGGDWRPYSDNGRWVYTDDGWTWDSDYEWGWAAFHYGRWLNDSVLGWIWQPGSVWAPAWVAWRGNDTYCGWAPLPPGTLYKPGNGFLFHGALVTMDFNFGLGADDYCFISIADICNPSYTTCLLPPARVAAVYRQTTTVKNAYGQNGQRLVNAGIALDRARQATHRDIQPMKITTVTSSRDDALKASRGAGDTFIVYQPKINLAARSEPLAAKPAQRAADILDDLINSKTEARASRPEPSGRADDVMKDLLGEHPLPQKPAQDSYDDLMGKLLTRGPDESTRRITPATSPSEVTSRPYPTERTPSPPGYHPAVRPSYPTAGASPYHPEVRPPGQGKYAPQPTEEERARAAREVSTRLKADERQRQNAAREELDRLQQMRQARMRAVPDRPQKSDEQSGRELQNPKRNPNNPL